MMTYLILVPLAAVGVVGFVLVKKGKSWGAILCIAAAGLSLFWTLAPASWWPGNRGGFGQNQRFGQRDAAFAEAIGKALPDRLAGDARVLVLGRGGWGDGGNNTSNTNAGGANAVGGGRGNAFADTWKKGLGAAASGGNLDIVLAAGRAPNTTGQPNATLPEGPFTLAIIDAQRVSSDYPVTDVIGSTPVVLIADQPTKPQTQASWNLPASQVIEVVYMKGDKAIAESASGS